MSEVKMNGWTKDRLLEDAAITEADDIDEDDISEDEEMYEQMRMFTPQIPDITNKLLNFVENINGDIKKYFGRKKNDPDSCDVYQDKWTSGKSGREMYYADLLRIAQGDNGKERKSPKTSKSSTSSYDSDFDIKHNDRKSKGNNSSDLGPLTELFEIGTRPFTHLSNKNKMKRPAVVAIDNIPMKQRKLPESFWKEHVEYIYQKDANSNVHHQKPIAEKVKLQQQDNAATKHKDIGYKKTNGMLPSPETPDFSDLLDIWTGPGTALSG
ncbi:unnamed protein product [Owenia fusiformis]|uniref:Uncharacterized protein n=1 Tax=Owenia fusiformis TaxID=6347 RepID=A0A8J1XYS2_OWEFU|nr:unnamed protein product [Owenia fusiformis]